MRVARDVKQGYWKLILLKPAMDVAKGLFANKNCGCPFSGPLDESLCSLPFLKLAVIIL